MKPLLCLAGVLLAALPALPVGPTGQDKQEPKKAQPKKSGTFLDPKEAGVDFALQGEYVGSVEGGGKLGCESTTIAVF